MRLMAIALSCSVFMIGVGDVHAQQNESIVWQKVAEAIPLGSKVKIQTHDSKRVNGTLMRVDGATVMVKRNTRRPEPAVVVPYDDIARLERDHGGGVNLGRAVAVGFATGAGVIVSLIIFAMQFD